MGDEKEYIFKKDFWGDWKLVPKGDDDATIIIKIVLFVVALLLGLLAILLSPLLIALLGFKMVNSKRYYAGIGAIIALIYFIIDIQEGWISNIFLFGYHNTDGTFTKGWIGEDKAWIFYLLNGIGIFIGLVFFYQAYSENKKTS